MPPEQESECSIKKQRHQGQIAGPNADLLANAQGRLICGFD